MYDVYTEGLYDIYTKIQHHIAYLPSFIHSYTLVSSANTNLIYILVAQIAPPLMLSPSRWAVKLQCSNQQQTLLLCKIQLPITPAINTQAHYEPALPRYLPWLTWVPERSCWQSASEFRLQTSTLACAFRNAQCHTQQLLPCLHSPARAAYSLDAISRHSPSRLLSFVRSLLIRLRAGPSTILRRHSPPCACSQQATFSPGSSIRSYRPPLFGLEN